MSLAVLSNPDAEGVVSAGVLDALFEISNLLLDRNATVEMVVRNLADKSAVITNSTLTAYFRQVDDRWVLSYYNGPTTHQQHQLAKLIPSRLSEIVWSDDLNDDRRFVTISDFHWINSILLMPVGSEHSSDGLLLLGNTRRQAYTGNTVRLMRNIASKANIAFENNRQVRMMQQEIAERRRVEQELLEITERYELAIDSNEVGIFDCDLITRRNVWSPGCESLFNIPVGRAGRVHFVDLVDVDDRARVERIIAEACRVKRARIEFEFRVPRPEGGSAVLSAATKFFYSDSGLPLRMVGCARDVTGRRKIEERLRRSEHRLQATYQQANIGISEVDAHGCYLRMNEMVYAAAGYTEEELKGRSFFDIGDDESNDRERDFFDNLIAGNLNSYTVERRTTYKDGSRHWIEVSMSAVRDDVGQFQYGVRVAKNIQDKKSAEEAKSLMLEELNHRVKNTMATIQNIARQTARTTTDINQFITKFDQRLVGLAATHNLLTEQNWSAVPLSDIVKAELMPFHGEDTLRWVITGPPVNLRSSETVSVGMIIHELATNAVKYGSLSNTDGHLTVSWSVLSEHGSRYLVLEWHENEGPAVTLPTRSGFGTKLLNAVAKSLSASIDVDYLPTGVFARLRMPLVS